MKEVNQWNESKNGPQRKKRTANQRAQSEAASQRSKQSKSLFLGRRSEAKERVELRLLMRRELVGFALFFDLWVMAAAPAAMLRKEKTS